MTRSPLPPKHLDTIARRKWREIFPTLADAEQGTLDALTQYCCAWSRWQQADDPADVIRWSRCVRQWGCELKLTPRSKTTRRKAAEDTRDPVLKLIARRAE